MTGAMWIGLLSGVIGTGLGGLMSGAVWRAGERIYAPLVSLTAGMMLAVVFLDLLPVGFEWGGLWLTLLVVVLGAALVCIMDYVLARRDRADKKRKQPSMRARMKTAVLVGATIALHNLPEGMAIGAGGVIGTGFGLSLALVIAMHDIPEGLAMALPLKSAGRSTFYVLCMTLLAGLPTAAGAVLGHMLGAAHSGLIAPCLSLAAGAMLYVSGAALIPDAFTGGGRRTGLWFILGALIGMAVTRLCT